MTRAPERSQGCSCDFVLVPTNTFGSYGNFEFSADIAHTKRVTEQELPLALGDSRQL